MCATLATNDDKNQGMWRPLKLGGIAWWPVRLTSIDADVCQLRRVLCVYVALCVFQRLVLLLERCAVVLVDPLSGGSERCRCAASLPLTGMRIMAVIFVVTWQSVVYVKRGCCEFVHLKPGLTSWCV